jgi:hypothetical protein
MVNSFQFTREVRLRLTHQSTQSHRLYRIRENNTFRGTEEQSQTEELRDVFLLASSV